MFDPSVPKRLKPHHIASIFNQKMYEALVWKMQQAKRFSDDNHEIRGSNIDLWEIVVGVRFAGLDGAEHDKPIFGVVTAKSSSRDGGSDAMDIMVLDEALVTDMHVFIGSHSCIYFERNNTFRTISIEELPEFWKAMEASYA